MTHPLAAYLAEQGLTQEEFATKADIERTVVTKVLNGRRRRFSVDAAQKIVKATGGKVTLEEALGVKPRANKSSKAA